MPTETFFNLPDEKKERIIEAAVDEFAENGFENAKVNEIVRKSSIPKGSFISTSETRVISSSIYWTLSLKRRCR